MASRLARTRELDTKPLLFKSCLTALPSWLDFLLDSRIRSDKNSCSFHNPLRGRWSLCRLALPLTPSALPTAHQEFRVDLVRFLAKHFALKPQTCDAGGHGGCSSAARRLWRRNSGGKRSSSGPTDPESRCGHEQPTGRPLLRDSFAGGYSGRTVWPNHQLRVPNLSADNSGRWRHCGCTGCRNEAEYAISHACGADDLVWADPRSGPDISDWRDTCRKYSGDEFDYYARPATHFRNSVGEWRGNRVCHRSCR